MRQTCSTHDARTLVGVPGACVAWVNTDGVPMLAAVLAVEAGGYVGFVRPRDAQAPLSASLSYAMADAPTNGAPGTEAHALATCFPTLHRSGGFPFDVAARRAAAAEMLPSFPAHMRTACHGALSEGAPAPATHPDLGVARRAARAPLWEATAFAISHPLLAHCLAEDRVTEALGAGASTRDALRTVWPGLTEGHLRRLRGHDFLQEAWLKPRDLVTAPATLSAAMSFPPEWLPLGTGWAALASTSYAAGVVSAHAGLPARDMLASSRGDWKAFLARCEAVRGHRARDFRPVDVGALAMDARDLVDHLATTLVEPLMATDDMDRPIPAPTGEPFSGISAHLDRIKAARHLAGRLAYGGKSLPAVLAASAEWHHGRKAIDDRIRSVPADGAWPALFQTIDLPSGVSVVCVRDQASLAEEGDAGPDRLGCPGLDHCVATRFGTLVVGTSHVVSVRRRLPGGLYARLSTAQVRVDDGRILQVEEHRGRSNAVPPHEAESALMAACEMLERGVVPMDPVAMVPRPGAWGGDERCGYDWRDAGRLTNALNAWDGFLPRWTRGLSPEGLLMALRDRGYLNV